MYGVPAEILNEIAQTQPMQSEQIKNLFSLDQQALWEALLDQGWHILGWKNQTTGDDYAVGGGIVQKMPPGIQSEIQTTLHRLAREYAR